MSRGRSAGTRAAAVRVRGKQLSVALTGANGFLGRNLIGMLQEDERISRIVALDPTAPRTAALRTRHYPLDLTQPGVDDQIAEILEAEQVDCLVHLAFLSSPTHTPGWAHELESVGTMHLLNACRKRPVSAFVLRSSTLLYGPAPTNPNFLTEDNPLRGVPGCPFLADKIEAEHEVDLFAQKQKGTRVTVLRLAPLLGPTKQSFVTRWLSRRLVPVMMGYDPLLQFLHEMDAVAAVKLAVDRQVAGTFNIVGRGVLPVSTVVRLAGRVAVPIPHFIAHRSTALMWAARLAEAPPALLSYLRFLCVADGARADEELGFQPAFTTREAVLDFEGALRLREAHLLTEAA